jgi:hypothetical protein
MRDAKERQTSSGLCDSGHSGYCSWQFGEARGYAWMPRGFPSVSPAAVILIKTQFTMASHAYLTRDEELNLHRRLVEGDPVASSELAEKYLRRLINLLRKMSNPRISQHFIEEARRGCDHLPH